MQLSFQKTGYGFRFMTQVHLLQYYFGDINLPKDRFLQEQIKLEDGWIPLEIMLTFKRLANLTTEPDVVVTALETSKLIEVRTCTVASSSLIQ
jgi:hypothetical protein